MGIAAPTNNPLARVIPNSEFFIQFTLLWRMHDALPASELRNAIASVPESGTNCSSWLFGFGPHGLSLFFSDIAPPSGGETQSESRNGEMCLAGRLHDYALAQQPAGNRLAAAAAAPVPERQGIVYLGQPKPLSDSELAGCAFVTDAGICPPVGTNHTTTRRIS